jgi:hypothetical protein
MFGEESKFWSSDYYIFFQAPVTSFLLGPNILLRVLFSDTLNLLLP